MKTLYVIDGPSQRDLIVKTGAPHDLEAPVIHRVIDWPWMRPWSSPYGTGAKLWARVQEVSKPLGAAFLDTGKAIPPRLSQGTNADTRTMVPLKERANIREGSWVCVEIIADARESKGPRGRLIPPIPEVAKSKGKAQLLRPAVDPLTALLETVDAVVCLSKPEAVAAIREARAEIPIDFFSTDTVDASDPCWNVIDGMTVALSGGLSLLVEPGFTGTMMDVNATVRASERLETNTRAANEIARVIAALNLGGLIVIDFLNLETKAERGLLTEHVREALTHPVCEFDVEPVNHLGIGLITRARRGFSIPEQQNALTQIQDRVPLSYAAARAEVGTGAENG